MIRIVPVGGRVKSASIGLDRFTLPQSAVELNSAISKLRREPDAAFRTAFFPRDKNSIRHAASAIGLYRPSLKTDQGMPGNFLPFTIDLSIQKSDLSVRNIASEEGVVIPEQWCRADVGTTQRIREAFRSFDLNATAKLLESIDSTGTSHRPTKGHRPYMFIRPAITDRPIVFGADAFRQAEMLVQHHLKQIGERSDQREEEATGKKLPHNLIFAQPDVYITTDGQVTVERINCPDVGFFLSDVDAPGTKIFPAIQDIVRKISVPVVENIVEKMGQRITIVTRDEVIISDEDILELREIRFLRSALEARGASIDVVSLSSIPTLEWGARLLLLNLNYEAPGINVLLERHTQEEVVCFPNPYFQMACVEFSGLQELVVRPTEKAGRLLLERARSDPSTEAGVVEALRLIELSLKERTVLTGDILHIQLKTEMVPVLRGSLHSWRQLARQAKEEKNAGGDIRIRSVPVCPDTLMLMSDTGPRLHAFRFMCVTQ